MSFVAGAFDGLGFFLRLAMVSMPSSLSLSSRELVVGKVESKTQAARCQLDQALSHAFNGKYIESYPTSVLHR